MPLRQMPFPENAFDLVVALNTTLPEEDALPATGEGDHGGPIRLITMPINAHPCTRPAKGPPR